MRVNLKQTQKLFTSTRFGSLTVKKWFDRDNVEPRGKCCILWDEKRWISPSPANLESLVLRNWNFSTFLSTSLVLSYSWKERIRWIESIVFDILVRSLAKLSPSMNENPLFLFDTEKSLSNQGIPGLVGGKSPIVLTEYALLVLKHWDWDSKEPRRPKGWSLTQKQYGKQVLSVPKLVIVESQGSLRDRTGVFGCLLELSVTPPGAKAVEGKSVKIDYRVEDGISAIESLKFPPVGSSKYGFEVNFPYSILFRVAKTWSSVIGRSYVSSEVIWCLSSPHNE